MQTVFVLNSSRRHRPSSPSHAPIHQQKSPLPPRSTSSTVATARAGSSAWLLSLEGYLPQPEEEEAGRTNEVGIGLANEPRAERELGEERPDEAGEERS